MNYKDEQKGNSKILMDPGTTVDLSDPGDQVLRNFRYQHAYGVILLIAGASGAEPYVYVYCEHHEDLLCECEDGRYDAYQVKTRRVEDGFWELTHDPLRKSIKRFVELVRDFGDHIRRITFVSNAGMRAAPIQSGDPKKCARDPWSLLRAVSKAVDYDSLPDPYRETHRGLATYCKCDEDELFSVLEILVLQKGPDRDGFEHEVAHLHLPAIGACQSMTPVQLDGVRDELIQVVSVASSLPLKDPSVRWRPQDDGGGLPSSIKAKRIAVGSVAETVLSALSSPMRFMPVSLPLDLSSGLHNYTADKRATGVLTEKLSHAGAGDHVGFLKRNTLSAEAKLAELVYQHGLGVVDRLAGVIETECVAAQLAADMEVGDGEPYGKQMLSNVIERLKSLADQNPERVFRQDVTCLLGVAGLLTEECRLWWSAPFTLGADS